MTAFSKISIVLIILIVLFLVFKPKNKALTIGSSMPEFELKNQDGVSVKSNSFIGNPTVIYFYPKDDTPGCTKEACSFRDSFEKFQDNHIKVVGISADNTASHKAFEEKYHLPFTLLADTERSVHKQFGVGKELALFSSRVTFVFDKDGTLIFMFKDNINATKHIDEALKALKINA